MTVKLDNADQAREIFGLFDRNVGHLEDVFNVKITLADDEIRISGMDEKCSFQAAEVLKKLILLAKTGQPITFQNVNYLVDLVREGDIDKFTEATNGTICYTTSGKPVKPKTIGQKKYVDTIRENVVTLSIGPAGTGKTYLAVALAVAAFKNKAVNRIVLTRPAVEAGESLGFLPGDLQDKVDPYLRPLYDVLREMFGADTYTRHIEKGLIEVAPLAYMRGRTLDDSYIILDEAQNTTAEQMKMFLTRIGFNSKAVVTGDITQIDLPPAKKSGLKEALHILNGIENIGIVHLTGKDVVRHELVQRIIKAYEEHELRKRK